MKIRSITYFTHPGWPLDSAALQAAADFINQARPAFEGAGFEVQTARLATPPFPTLLPDCSPRTVVDFAQALEAEAAAIGFDYVSIGPALPDLPESYAVIPDVIASTENTFTAAVMASREAGVSLPAVHACAEIIHALALQQATGFANLYFASLGNVRPGGPFFPAAYHRAASPAGGPITNGPPPAFAIATEAADLAVTAFNQAHSLQEARDRLTAAIETGSRQIVRIADVLGIRFNGIDYSLAPFPEAALSLGTAMETLGGMKVGRHGSLAAAAFIADTIDKAVFPHTGFSGMMLPVLEDATLSASAAQGVLSVKDLLLYATVCGTGLDTVPLPGDVSVEALAALLLDLAVLSVRLDKPLTARLMPIPGKKAGDLTDFDFSYFANSRVMALDAEALSGVLGGEEMFELGTRKG